jgi:hypothetical protein
MRDEIDCGCSEEFAELCALSTAGELTAAEERRLQAHVAFCPRCALLLAQYADVASAGMASIDVVNGIGRALKKSSWN